MCGPIGTRTAAFAKAFVRLRVRGRGGGGLSGSPGSAIGCCLMEHWNMVANFHSATIWSSPTETPALLSCGFVRIVMRRFAVYMTASWADTWGI